MTLSRASDDHGNHRVSTVNCPLCGVPLKSNVSVSEHIVHTCPARAAFREPGALERGGPTEAEVRAVIQDELAGRSGVAADGGEIPCDRCDQTVSPEDHRVYLQPSGDHEDLCLECQTGVPSDRLFRPASSQDGGSE